MRDLVNKTTVLNIAKLGEGNYSPKNNPKYYLIWKGML